MLNKLIMFSVLFSIPAFSVDTPFISLERLNHETLFHLNELREAEDQINFFQLALDHSKAKLEFMTFQVETTRRLFQRGAATEVDLKTSEKNLNLLLATIEMETLKMEQQLLNITIKKHSLLSKEGRPTSLKEMAQLFADQWKVKLKLGTVAVKLAQIELDFANYEFKKVEYLTSKHVSVIEDLYEVSKDKKKAEESVTILTNRLISLEKNYLEGQDIANKLPN